MSSLVNSFREGWYTLKGVYTLLKGESVHSLNSIFDLKKLSESENPEKESINFLWDFKIGKQT